MPLLFICVPGNVIYSIFINNNNIICDRVRKEIIMLKKTTVRVFHRFMEKPSDLTNIIQTNEMAKIN